MKSLSIRNILLLTLGCLTLIITIFSIKEVYVTGNKVLAIYSLSKASQTSDILFATVEKYTIARGLTSTMAYSKDPKTTDSLKQRAEKAQNEADTSFEEAIRSLEEYNLKGMHEKINHNIETLNRLKELRKELSADVYSRNIIQKEKTYQEWFSQVTKHIKETQEIWMLFIRNFSDIDPIITLQLRFKHFLSVTMEYTGKERAVIGQLIMQNIPPTPEQQANLLIWHGAAMLSWERLDSLAVQSGLDSAILPYLRDAQSHYFNLYSMVQKMFYTPGRKFSGEYPMNVDFWLEISSQTNDSVNELKNAAVATSRKYRQELTRSGNISIVIHLIIMAFSIFLCLYSFIVVRFRVIKPINDIIESLLLAASGKHVNIEKIVLNNNDEIGKLGRVLIALQQSMSRYRALVEASSQIIWTWKPDKEDEMVALKKWWNEVTGQPEDKILPSGWLEMLHPDDREGAGNAWAKASTEGTKFEIEYRLKAKDGKYRNIYVRGVPLKKENGELIEVVGALNDITLRKEAEEKLMGYMKDLERSNKELDDFAYIASHDLKEPLRGIHNHSRFLLEDNEKSLEKESVDRLNRLVYLSQRMEHLVNDLLYFSRLGRQDLAIQKTNLNEVIVDIEDTIDLFLKEHNAKITIPKTLPEVICDKTRLTEVFRNLITNAIKYNDKENKIVEVGYLPEYAAKNGTKSSDVFYVKDNGNGIAKEFYDEIFRIFKRLQNVKNKEEQGTGVGLTFVKKIIERHGGAIWLESEINTGTIFYFTLEGKNHAKTTNS